MTETIALLKTSLADTLRVVRDTAQALRVKADADRETLLALIAGMRDTSHEMALLAEICGEAGDLLHETSEETYRVVDVVNDSLSGADIIPECSYEKFYGYCAECGCELTTDDDIAYNDADQPICADCADFLEAVEEMDEELADEDEDEDEDCADCEFAETCDAPDTKSDVNPAE